MASPYKGRGPKTPLKTGRNGTRSINGQLATLTEAVLPATTAKAGTVKKGVAVANAVGANPTKAEFDALLASLRTAGVITT